MVLGRRGETSVRCPSCLIRAPTYSRKLSCSHSCWNDRLLEGTLRKGGVDRKLMPRALSPLHTLGGLPRSTAVGRAPCCSVNGFGGELTPLPVLCPVNEHSGSPGGTWGSEGPSPTCRARGTHTHSPDHLASRVCCLHSSHMDVLRSHADPLWGP